MNMDYCQLDRPEILERIFHPRPAPGSAPAPEVWEELLIPVAPDVSIGAQLHMAGADAPTLLFFHGNGEIVADYAELGRVYRKMGINFLPVDYRGYGRSSGRPTISAMMTDCRAILSFVQERLAQSSCTGPLVVMGRSLGSAPALELAAEYPDDIGGLIIESGFARLRPLLALLGVAVRSLFPDEEPEVGNLEKIRGFTGPTLVIHAARDSIIPFSDGQALYEAAGAEQKRFLEIPDADHNDIFLKGLSEYLSAVQWLMRTVQGA